jgi:hypothetical protein
MNLVNHRALTLSALALGATKLACAGGMVVPAYFYPNDGGNYGDDWYQLAAGAAYMQANGLNGYNTLIAVGNPNSGPGSAEDPNYLSAFTNVRANKGKVVGYVWTNYGAQPLATVENQIKQWVSWYGSQLDGIFLDGWGGYQSGNIPGVKPAMSYLTYYQDLYNYVTKTEKLPVVVANPGWAFDATQTNPACVATATIFCVDEQPYSNITAGYPLPLWLQTAGNTTKGCVIYYQLPLNQPSTLTSVVETAKSEGASWIYCTDNQSASNPYNNIPGVASGNPDGQWNSYWGNEEWSVAQATG